MLSVYREMGSLSHWYTTQKAEHNIHLVEVVYGYFLCVTQEVKALNYSCVAMLLLLLSL